MSVPPHGHIVVSPGHSQSAANGPDLYLIIIIIIIHQISIALFIILKDAYLILIICKLSELVSIVESTYCCDETFNLFSCGGGGGRVPRTFLLIIVQ